MKEKTVNIRETFAKNLRENRRKCGLTQAQLAEKADISHHYLAMVELSRNIPKVETIERLAKVLNVEFYELFIVPLSPAMEMKKIHEVIISDMKQIVSEAVEKAIDLKCKKRR
ncbi:MAG: helix-turn-helix domain-containing protein [Paludibacter sp.]|nr:helix-turn-helix domain-containing protein [Paludibacter sp.]